MASSESLSKFSIERTFVPTLVFVSDRLFYKKTHWHFDLMRNDTHFGWGSDRRKLLAKTGQRPDLHMKWPWSHDSFIWVYANGTSRFPVQISKSPSLPHPLILSPKRRTMLLAKEGGAKWWQLHWDFNTTEFFLRVVRKANSVGKSGKRLRW